ncbi:hypothetical protein [Scytonema sp. NUACC21]
MLNGNYRDEPQETGYGIIPTGRAVAFSMSKSVGHTLSFVSVWRSQC